MAHRDELRTLRDRRFAANQTVFRRANERLHRQLENGARGPVHYVCECGDDGCVEVVSLLPSEYDHVRSKPTRFLIALGHQILAGDSERIMETYEHHHVVEKSGAAGEVAAAMDTRRNRTA